jgi:hypothetical protein
LIDEEISMSSSRMVVALAAAGIVFFAMNLSAMTEEDRQQAIAAATLQQMEMIGTGIEAYITDYNSPPQVTTMEELKKALVSTYLKDVPLRDSWDKPYHYEAAGRSYKLVSSGSDGKFEPATWSEKRLIADTAADAVWADGAFTRSWAFDHGASARVEAAMLGKLMAEQKAKLEKLPADQQWAFTWMTITSFSMRSIANALGKYADDRGHYPKAASIDELKTALFPQYINSMETADGWSTPFRYSLSADGKSYTLVSAGADKVFHPESWSQPAKLSSYADDAVIVDGKWAREWKPPE